MKKIKLLFTLLLCVSAIFAQQTKRIHPDKATHYIKGDFSAHMQDGKPVYKLRNVSTEGISFHQADTYYGAITDLGDLCFTFDSARTTYPGGFAENDLAFWFYDKEIGEWQPDIEIRQATGSFDNRKIMTIMLVLDCSTSLGKDFSRVKAGAKYFLEKLVSASNTGNVRIGIIGFSSLKNTNKGILPIQKLTTENYHSMLNFIDNLTMDNGTALYYAIDKSVNALDQYANALLGEDVENYARSCIVTFTDGIDQQSQNFDKDIFVAEDYYNYIRPILKDNSTRKKIYGRNIETRILSVKGNDITSAKLEEKFDNDLKAICDNYTKMRNINELQNEFANISKLLIDKSMQLQCYVPMGFRGRVGWTFSSVKKEPVVEYKPEPIKIKKQNKN